MASNRPYADNGIVVGYGLLTVRSCLHPVLEIRAEKPPVLTDLGRWNLSQSGKLIDRRFRDPQKMRHFRYGEDVTIQSAIAVRWCIR